MLIVIEEVHDREGRAIELLIHGEKCGKRFPNIAQILEPCSENPLLWIEKPLGLQAVAKIVAAVGSYQEILGDAPVGDTFPRLQSED